MDKTKPLFTLMQWIGISGVAVSATVSWSLNKSVFWAGLHSLCGWLYVIYYAVSV